MADGEREGAHLQAGCETAPIGSRLMTHMLKDALKGLLSPLIRLLRYFWANVSSAGQEPGRNAFHVVLARAAESSADYIEEHLDGAMLFDDRSKLWDFALARVQPEGLCCEFGVYKGESITYFGKAMSGRSIYGFDSFEGLKEDWHGTQGLKGDLDVGGKLPLVPPNVHLIKGWFDKTVPEFLAQHKEHLSFVHFDADTYKSTRLLFDLLGDRIRAGTVIVFDEYLGVPNWRNGEFRAWQEYVARTGVTYEYLAFAPEQAAVRVL
jgi:hypothetical protein